MTSIPKCEYHFTNGGVHYDCNAEATHTHNSGKPLCKKHFKKTLNGTISTYANKHRNLRQKLQNNKT